MNWCLFQKHGQKKGRAGSCRWFSLERGLSFLFHAMATAIQFLAEDMACRCKGLEGVKMCPLFFLCMTAVGHMLVNCRADVSTVVVLRVKTDPSLTFGYVQMLLFLFFKAILIGPECEMWSLSCWCTCFFTTLHHYKVDSPRPVSFARNSVLHFLSHLFNKSLKPPLTPAMCIYRLLYSFSSLIKHNDFALFIYGTSNSPVYIWTESH